MLGRSSSSSTCHCMVLALALLCLIISFPEPIYSVRTPLPNITRELDPETHCKGGCTPAPGGNKLGDSCDPALWRRMKRDDDDCKKCQENFEKPIPDPATPDHFTYKGECTHYCPAMMCASTAGADIDVYKLDCVSTNGAAANANSNTGVCTCGAHLESHIDPVSTQEKIENGLVIFTGLNGLDRKLVWDEKNQRCAANQYGHCSLDWESSYPDIPDDQKTFCYDPEQTCFNLSQLSTAGSHLPFKTQDKVAPGRWYGVCDYVGNIPDPFAGGRKLTTNIGVTLSFIIILYMYFKIRVGS